MVIRAALSEMAIPIKVIIQESGGAFKNGDS
jgi:hypothetical protein